MRFAPQKLTDEELVTLWPTVAESKPYGIVSDALPSGDQAVRWMHGVSLGFLN